MQQKNGWTYGILANHVWSVAGPNGRANISATFLQPFLSYTTKTYTTFGLNTESTYDWQQHQWTVPLNATVSQLVKIGGQPISFGIGGRYYADKPAGGPDWGAAVRRDVSVHEMRTSVEGNSPLYAEGDETLKKTTRRILVLVCGLVLSTMPAFAQNAWWNELANLPFPENYPTKHSSQVLLDELTFQRAVQVYLWALPAMNMYGMKEGSEKIFGKSYSVLPVFKQRLNAKTLVTTPNSDVIYAMGYLDLKEDGPLVIEVPPKLQGLLDDFWQRPLCDVGFAGPDKGQGGNYLILPPDYKGEEPKGYFTFRSRTYGVFVFWRAFYQDPCQTRRAGEAH